MSNKSLMKNTFVGESGRAHACRRNKAHKLPKGTTILIVKEGRDEFHYCLPCASKLIGIARTALEQLETDTAIR